VDSKLFKAALIALCLVLEAAALVFALAVHGGAP